MVLSNFLGMCSFISVSSEYKTATGLGKAVLLVMVFTTVINWLLYHYVMVPLGLDYLRYLLFIIVIAATVQIIEMFMDRYLTDLHMKLGIFLPLITVNCAILGISLFMIIRSYSFLQTFAFAVGSGIGWTMAIVALAGIRQRLKRATVPKGLEGPGITLIVTGLMAMAFIGFSGIVQIQ